MKHHTATIDDLAISPFANNSTRPRLLVVEDDAAMRELQGYSSRKRVRRRRRAGANMKTDSKRSIPALGRRKRHFYLPTTTAVALLALLPFAGCKKEGAAAGAGAPGGMPPQEVGIIVVKPQRTEIVSELPGRTAAFRVAEVRPQVSGIVLRRQFTEGGEVDENEQLYQIDPATYRATYDSAQAAVARAEAARVLAKLNADRQKRLFDTHVASKEEYDTTFASLKQAEADLASAKASLEAARISLVYTKVLSPISGIIGRSAVTEGALVTSGQATALSTVQQLDPIYVDVTQSSAQLLRLQRELGNGQLANAGQQEASAKLILEDGTEYSETGKLQFSEVTVDQGTGSVTLRAVFPNPRRELLPGMFVRALVREGVSENAILVPQKGVSRNQRGEPVALVVAEGNRVEQRVLKTDRTIGENWLVTNGIKTGDRVIVEGLQKTGPGAQVNPVEIVTEATKTASTN